MRVSKPDAALDRGPKQGLAVSLEALDHAGQVVQQRRDQGLLHYGEALPGAVRVIRWINDHLPKDNRIRLTAG